MGHRPRRLPGRRLPAAVDRVERRLPRHRARLLARRAVAGRVRLPAVRVLRPLRALRPPARSPASTSSPPTTASPCATSCPTTRSTTRPTARTTTTARATTARGTTASRARPTTPRSSSARAREQRNFLATLLLSQGVPMLLHGDELSRTQDGNNNTYAQDSEISWVALGPAPTSRSSSSPPRVAKLRAEPPDVPPQALLHRHARCAPATASGSTTSSGCASTASRWRTATGRAAQGDRHVPQRRRHRRQGRPRRHHHRRPLPALLQRRRPGRR